MTGNVTASLHIVGLTDRCVQCVTLTSTAEPFWLPRGTHVRWAAPPAVGQQIDAHIPHWLCLKHRQLAGDEASEAKRTHQRPLTAQTERNETMADREQSGALSRNDKKSKPAHPDYQGDIVIAGRKYWLSGWVKDGKDGKKFLSLAATPAEEKNGSAARRSAPVDDDSKTSYGAKRTRELDDLEFSGATYD
jgi:hypothetical protein